MLLLYFGRSGPDARKLLAYDEVTVGGLGLAEVNLQRTVLSDEDRPALSVPTPTGSGSGSASAAASATTPSG